MTEFIRINDVAFQKSRVVACLPFAVDGKYVTALVLKGGDYMPIPVEDMNSANDIVERIGTEIGLDCLSRDRGSPYVYADISGIDSVSLAGKVVNLSVSGGFAVQIPFTTTESAKNMFENITSLVDAKELDA